MKTKVLTQATKTHGVNKLHDAFIAAGLIPLSVESTATESTFRFEDAVTDLSIDNVIAAYTFVTPPVPDDVKVLWQNWITAFNSATTLAQMKTAMGDHLNKVLKKGFQSVLGD